ncbi:CDP-alcohol phosphatidyltransferase [Sphingomonas guangdongensis]|uniref:CDP-alcohol phosphatidyltransferase n=1 Tax=Sphingomonas guangdongensis TaxID=1141890 RepID=A0A285R2G7_9SPHN|nr:CDP-alcohol phosphatidyltransferase family protein [Sphingomonas guangdongensis]SOB87919.1 CDP-alcohol phosphatidyltransferase [Sphingomonas guangdongensis]
MTSAPRDTSRDRRIEDPTNLYLIHPAAHALLPLALRWRVSANAVSACGLVLGAAAAWLFYRWRLPGAATLGLAAGAAWLIADGLDGMVARATRTASALGRALDGMVDHGVFALLYVALAASLGTVEAWLLAVAAGIAHAVQSAVFEGERARFHRRVAGRGFVPYPPSSNPLVSLHNWVSTALDRRAAAFEKLLAASRNPARVGQDYGSRAAPVIRAMALLSANMRLLALWLACVLGNPRLFWWIELVPMTLILILTLSWHRRVEAMTVRLHRA